MALTSSKKVVEARIKFNSSNEIVAVTYEMIRKFISTDPNNEFEHTVKLPRTKVIDPATIRQLIDNLVVVGE